MPKLDRHTDARGMPYITTTVRVTGEAAIAAFERACEVTGQTPATLATELVTEEIRYMSVPRMRAQVRASRAERRGLFDPGGDRR